MASTSAAGDGAPLSEAGLEPEYLSARLHAVAEPGDVITDIATESVGVGKAGKTLRCRLTWRIGSGPDRVVAKLASDDETSRRGSMLAGSYLREVRFFEELAGQVDIRTPACFFASIDPTTGDFTLLLEDLAPAMPGDQLAGCDDDDAELALAELIGLHSPDVAGTEQCDWLHSRRPDGAATAEMVYRIALDQFLERYADRLGDEAVATTERFADLVRPWMEGAPGPYRLVHGDYRLDNLMFGDHGVTVLDWQTAGLGPPVSDVAYFLGAGLTIDRRRDLEDELVRGYHSRLITAEPGILGWEQCWSDYRRHAVGGLHMAVVASMLTGADERGDDLFVTMAERHVAHMSDLDSLGLIAAES